MLDKLFTRPGCPECDARLCAECDPANPQIYRIPLSDRDDTLFAVVDKEDYEWALKWKWHAVKSRGCNKFYAARNTRQRGVHPKQIKIFLHKEILIRTGKPQPSPAHHIGDHEDGDSLNDRRFNLNWSTPSMNRRTARRKPRG
jgi:hypothetical protein